MRKMMLLDYDESTLLPSFADGHYNFYYGLNPWDNKQKQNKSQMQSRPKLISNAGRQYETQKNIRPLNTRDRLRMYHSIEVEPTHRTLGEKKQSMDTVDREQKDSFHLRYNKQVVTDTNYHINDEPTYNQAKRVVFDKGYYKRIIGDVRDQNYSLPLPDDCDRRCSDAFITLPHLETIVTPHDIANTKKLHHHLNFAKQLSRDKLSQSLDLKKVNSIKSTQQTEFSPETSAIIKRRNKREKNLEVHDALKRIRLFDYDIGHKYAEALYTPKKIPEFYDVQKSKEELIKPSMASPKGYVSFGSYREKIATRYDRVDPQWGMTINYEHTHENPEWKQAKTIKMEKVSARRLNEVYSKYPIRQSMKLVTPKNYNDSDC